ncbi:MAG: urease accessory protein UreF [Magnetovibrio sp.]|nr:urease accessory protein UreF [Magnetovibrio sp.]
MTTDASLIRLMTWLSPSFPVGAFAYSHGLEHAVETGEVHDATALTYWVQGLLAFGSGRVDAALFRAAYEAMQNCDEERLQWVVERGEAQRGTSELALESVAQGRAFLETILKVWPQERLTTWHASLKKNGYTPAYPVALGVACALADIPLRFALMAYLHAFCANLVSAVVRLVPLGQTDGQKVLAALEPRIVEAGAAALKRDPDNFGSASVMIDWHSIQHETQYTRLFRS